MLRLQLFGGLSLLDDGAVVGGPASQRRKLALLARISASPSGTISRDKLVACFWPEEDRERSRHHLADAVFTLRKQLGKESITTVGDDLLLNPEAFGCDLWRFRDALAAGEPETAVGLYTGPFLDGFFVADAPAFEQWVEEERARLAALYAAALEELAEESERRSDAERAVHWWRRSVMHDPFSSRIALRYMQALASSGDRAAAVQHARVHAALLRGELEVEPDPAVAALAARLSAAPADPPPGGAAVTRPPPPPPPIPTPADAPPDGPRREAAPEPAASEPAPPIPIEGAAADPNRSAPPIQVVASRGRGPTLAVLALLAVILIAGVGLWTDARRAWSRAPADAEAAADLFVVAVLPFSFSGSSDYAYLGEGLVSVLSTNLDGVGSLRTVDPHVILSRIEARTGDRVVEPAQAARLADSLGAGAFVLGTVVESGGRLQIDARLYVVDGEPRRVGSWSVAGRDEWALMDDLYRQMLETEFLDPADRLRQLAVRTSRSMGALKAYLEGERHFRAARYVEAAAALQRAVEIDPSYAIAHYRLSTAAEWSFDFARARGAAERAHELSAALSPRDQRLIAAWNAFVRGDADEAERLYDRILTEDPLDVEAWSGLGEVRLHFNPQRGRPIEEALPPFQQVQALAPHYGEALFHLLEFAAARGDRTEFDSLLAGVDPQSQQRLSWEAARALAWGSASDKAAMMERLRQAEDVVVGIAAIRLAVHFNDLPAAQAAAGLLTRAERLASWRAAGHIMRAQGHLAAGRWEEAQQEIDRGMPLEPAWALEMRALASLLPMAPSTDEELREVARLLQEWNPGASSPDATFFFGTHAEVHPQLRHYLLGLTAIRLDRDAAAAEHAEALRRDGGSSLKGQLARSLSLSIEAHRAWRRGDGRSALGLLDQAELRIPLERAALSPFFARALDRDLRAEILAAAGEHDEALRWYRSLSESPDLLFRRSARLRQAELLTRLGRSEDARSHEQQ